MSVVSQGGGKPPEEVCDVRRAAPEDCADLERVLAGAHNATCEQLFGVTTGELLTSPLHKVYISYISAEAIGCVMSTNAVLHCLGIVTEYRARDLGYQLIKAVIEMPEPDAPAYYWTAVDPKKPRAGDRFRRLGFQDMPQPLHDYIVLRWTSAAVPLPTSGSTP